MVFFTQVTNYLRWKNLLETFSITTPNVLYIILSVLLSKFIFNDESSEEIRKC